MLNKEKKKIGGLAELSNWVDIEKLEKGWLCVVFDEDTFLAINKQLTNKQKEI